MGDNRNEILRFWIEKMLQNKGINKYTLDVLGSSSKGDGYMGDINFLKVDCDLENGKKKVFDIVIKSNKIKLDQHNFLDEDVFNREKKMYTEVFPAIENLQKEHGIENLFLGYAKCYWVCTEKRREALLLKNLKSLNYLLHNSHVPQNFDHAMLVFRNYAMWHGSTIALKMKKPELFKQITNDMSDLLGYFVLKENWPSLYKKCLQNATAILKKGGNTLAAEKFENADIDILKTMTKLTLNDDEEAQKEAVILHGDCWNNNMMFKYGENNTSKPIDVKFLDFQISRVASPILDLSYYLYSIADKSILDKFDDLLKEYHKTMSSYLRQFDINCDDILSLEKLKRTWKKYGKFGLLTCPFIVRVELSQEDEFFDFSNTTNNNWDDIIDKNIKLQEEYDRRVYDVYSHFAEKFL